MIKRTKELISLNPLYCSHMESKSVSYYTRNSQWGGRCNFALQICGEEQLCVCALGRDATVSRDGALCNRRG